MSRILSQMSFLQAMEVPKCANKSIIALRLTVSFSPLMFHAVILMSVVMRGVKEETVEANRLSDCIEYRMGSAASHRIQPLGTCE